MAKKAGTDIRTFFRVFLQEVDVINVRRRAVAKGQLAADRGYPFPDSLRLTDEECGPLCVTVEERVVETPSGPICLRDERGRRVPRPGAGHNLTGLALSGGGIRSASFCLGVLQCLDAIRADKEPQVFGTIDYLSTVSGGGYIGTSLVAGLMQAQGKFPFASKLDQEETLETQHLRDYSNFLTPNGPIDLLVGVIAVFRGLLINALAFLGLLLLLAAITVGFNPTRADLDRPAFFWTIVGGILLVSTQALSVIVSSHWKDLRASLEVRERINSSLALAFVAWLAILLFEAQPYVLAGIFDASRARGGGSVPDGNMVARVLHWLDLKLPSFWAGLIPAALALSASVGKMSAVARATLGDQTWTGSIKRWASLAGLYLMAAIVPLLLWSTYLLLSFWGIGNPPRPGGSVAPAFNSGWSAHPQAPEWLNTFAHGLGSSYPFALAYGLLALVSIVLSFGVRPNAGSLHGYYRDRLSRAFLWQLDVLERNARHRDEAAVERSAPLKAALSRLRRRAAEIGRQEPQQPVLGVDGFKLSSLKSRLPDGAWSPDVRFAPYLIVNTAVNLEGSEYLNRRGRNADSFLFSPLFVGSEATKYIATTQIEAVDPDLNLGTAMAASGAAASANMGASTIRPLTFSLAALNVRLGYWLPNPRWLTIWHRWTRLIAGLGPVYFALEALGHLDERTRNVYLTDGGHFDNLGLYELLKRRCRLIVVADAEADPPMNFESFIRLQRYARIDLGIRIDLPWEMVRRSALGVTAGTPYGPLDDATRCHGPHVAIGRIEYGENATGVLVYIKASLSGDESDLIRDYKRRYNDFPHETTLDQFFSEEQFEVYRALGFHATRGFFTGQDRFGTLDPHGSSGLLQELDQVLKHINIPDDARGRIIERASRGPIHPKPKAEQASRPV